MNCLQRSFVGQMHKLLGRAEAFCSYKRQLIQASHFHIISTEYHENFPKRPLACRLNVFETTKGIDAVK